MEKLLIRIASWYLSRKHKLALGLGSTVLFMGNYYKIDSISRYVSMSEDTITIKCAEYSKYLESVKHEVNI